MNKFSRYSIWPLAGMVLCACSSAPVRLHSLLPAATATPIAAAESMGGAFAMDRVTVPRQADIPNLLVGPDERGAVLLLENEHWASPLPEQIGAAVSQALQQLLGLADVSQLPVAPAMGLHRVRLDVQRFEVSRDGELLLSVQWTLSTTHPAAVVANCRTQVQEGGLPDSTTARVAAYRGALSKLAADIADSYRRLHKEPGKSACDRPSLPAT